MKKRLILLGISFLFLSVSQVKATICVTINNGNYSDPAHWLNGIVPTATDTAIINHETYNVGIVTVKRIEINHFLGGAIPSMLTITSEGFWTVGITISANITNNGVFIIQNNPDRQMQGDIINNGTIHWTGGSVGVVNKTFTNNGTLFANAIGKSFGAVLSAAFVNNGLISVGSAGVVSITPTTLANNGNIVVNTGTMALAGTTTNSDTISISGGATLRINSFPANLVLNTGSGLLGAGTLQVQGLITPNIVQEVFPQFFLDFGTVNSTGTGSLNLLNHATWVNGFIQRPVSTAPNKNLHISQTNSMGLNSTLTIGGTATWSAGAIQWNNGSIVNNDTFFVTGNINMQGVGGTNLFTNNGYAHFANPGTATIGVPVNNTGTFSVGGTTVNAGQNFVNSGIVTVAAGKLLILATSTHNPGAQLDGDGTIRTFGSMTVNTPITVGPALEWLCCGTNSGTGSITIDSSLLWTGGTISFPVTINPGKIMTVSDPSSKNFSNTTLNNQGTLNYNGSGWSLSGTAILDNDGTMNMQGTSINLGGSTTTLLRNDGTLNFDQTGTSNIQSAMTNNGTINVNGGTGVAAQNFTNNGTIDVDATHVFILSAPTAFNAGTQLQGAGTLRNTNNLTFNTAVVADCFFEMNGGNLNPPGSLTINNGMNWLFSNVNTTLTINPGMTLTVSNSSSKSLNNATLLNQGTLNYNGSGWNLSGTAVLDNDGTMSVTTATTLGGSGTTLLQNDGNFVNDHTGSTSLNTPFSNGATGTVRGRGTLNFNSNLTNNGTVAPGLSPGVLTLNKMTNSNLEIELAGTGGGGNPAGHDSLRVNSVPTLGGTLAVKFIGGYLPQPGHSFTFLTASGNFASAFSSVTFDPALQPGFTGNVSYGSNFATLTFGGTCPTLYADADGDGFGDASVSQPVCIATPAFVANDDDCNDANPAIFPGAPELCNGVDDNCDTVADNATNTWAGTGDGIFWSDAANWSLGVVPETCHEVVIPSGTATVPAAYNAVARTLTVATGAILTVVLTGVLDVQN